MSPPPSALSGKICLITGASAGIGHATALGLARLGATVVMVSRSRTRGEAARQRVVEGSGNERVELLLADLASQRDVRELAAGFMARYPRLDVLVNNAATFAWSRTTTEDGIETQLAVNHLAPFLLTSLLLPHLRRSAPARVVTVSSEAHRYGRIRWDDPGSERRYNGLRAYAQSKLANLLFTFELARRLEGTGVTANAAHPGLVATGLLLDPWRPLRLLRRFMRTPEEGARTSIHLASAPQLDRVTGAYFRDCRPIPPAPRALDASAARRLWELSEQLTDR